MAVLLESDGQTEAALHQAQDAVNSAPDSGWAHLVAGRLLLELDRTAEARPHLAQAVQMEPGMAEAHEQLGMALIRTGRVQEAKQEWARAIQLAPERPEPHFRLGLLLADELGGRDVGIALLTRAVALRPNDPRAAAALKITTATRAGPEADEQRERSLAERFPAQPSAHFSLGVALLRQGMRDRERTDSVVLARVVGRGGAVACT
jgi:tetratricopeptide (TPR) repeat protein